MICLYESRDGDFPVLICARVLRVPGGCVSSKGCTSQVLVFRNLFHGQVLNCL